jgi:putative transposase
MLENPEDYRWSSHRTYLGKEVLPWLSTDGILSRFSPGQASARQLYRDFIADGMGGGHRDELHSGTREGRILGNDNFAEVALRRAGEKMKRQVSMEEIIAHVCKGYKLEREALVEPGKNRKCSEARAMIALLVWHEDGLSLTDLGRRLGRDLSSLSQAVSRLRKRIEKNPSLARALDTVRQNLAEIHISQA